MHDPRAEDFVQIYDVYGTDTYGRVPTLTELDPYNHMPLDSEKAFARRIPIQIPMDTILEIAPYEDRLIYATTLELNKSNTKKIIIGINPCAQFRREIRIYDANENYITLTLEEAVSLTNINFDMQWDLEVPCRTLRIYRNPENNICTVELNQSYKMRMGLSTIRKLKDNFYIIYGLYNKLAEVEGDIAFKKILALSLDIGNEFKFIVPSIEKVKEIYFKSCGDYENDNGHLISTMLLKFPNFFITLLEWNWEQNCNCLEEFHAGVKLYYRDDYCP